MDKVKNRRAVEIEYKMLRNEMLEMFLAQSRLEVALLTVYGLIVAYLLAKENVNPYFFLATIPFVLLVDYVNYLKSCYIWKGAAYCIVFFEEHGFTWEPRLFCHRKGTGVFTKNHSKYFPVPLNMSFLLCSISVLLYSAMSESFLNGIIAFIIFYLVFYAINTFLKKPFKKVFPLFLSEWERVKDYEINKQKGVDGEHSFICPPRRFPPI